MNNKTYEMLRCGTTDWYVVRCRETGTETIGLRKPRAARVLRALRGVTVADVLTMSRAEIVAFAVGCP